jgi:hypothetical protein
MNGAEEPCPDERETFWIQNMPEPTHPDFTPKGAGVRSRG